MIISSLCDIILWWSFVLMKDEFWQAEGKLKKKAKEKIIEKNR